VPLAWATKSLAAETIYAWGERRKGMPGKRGIAYRVLKWIGLAIAAAVIAEGIRVGNRAYRVRQSVQSASNLRELGVALAMYANDHSGHYPDHLDRLFVEDTGLRPEFFVVPWGASTPAGGATPQEWSARFADGGHCSYAYLVADRTVGDIAADDVLMYEADGSNPAGGINCLFGDGHIESMPIADAIKSIIRTVTRANHPATLPTTAPQAN
jgi:prepilin-type processing-associated H-X9-DG protein